MGIKLIRIFSCIAAISILLYSCVNNTEEIVDKEEDLIIRLKWFSGSFDQSKEEAKAGFAWTLSSLGALLPAGSVDKVMTEFEENLFEIDLSQAGFTDEALEALGTIVSRMKSSHAYETNSYIEMGRFVMLTLNSSNHYYEITQAPKTIDEFRSNYAFNNGAKMRVIKSSISITPRLIEIAEASKYEEIAYLAVEGIGSFEDETFEAKEFEVFSFMPNGQLQFAIYDVNGRLKEAADDSFTIAGKLAKCLWCHETSIQPLFQEDPVLEGDTFISEEDFSILRDKQNLFLAEYRSSLRGDIDFFNLQDHRFQEYLYIDFMEPSIERIALEWGMGIDEVALILADVSTHTQSEYNIENVYDRNDIEPLAPYTSLAVPESAREFSKNEPNFFIF